VKKKADNLSWHLAENTNEFKIIDFEFLFWRAYYSWIRWQEDCQQCSNHDDLSAQELALLHIIRIKNRAKSIYEIGRLLNRDDMPNIQYGVKKLVDLGYVEKVEVTSGVKKATAYQVTEIGEKNTERYTLARKKILLKMLDEYGLDSIGLENAKKTLTVMKSMYEEASRLTALYEEDLPE
tara:strand:+ start:274 stop:813 length:540 start_codon:yes stop_codon:yes gene_type:complete